MKKRGEEEEGTERWRKIEGGRMRRKEWMYEGREEEEV